jgi:hypothetical protein
MTWLLTSLPGLTNLSATSEAKWAANFYPLLSYPEMEEKNICEMGDFQKNEDFSFSENNLNIKWYERKVNILKQAQW